MPVTRHEFIATTAAAGAGVLLAPRAPAATDSASISLNGPIGRIAPEIQGHFAEHLGGVVYDGIWVGEGSTVPNDGGVRRALVDHLNRLGRRSMLARRLLRRQLRLAGWHRPPREPADADELLGARQRRTEGPQRYEPNAFGTSEFLRFCQLAGAQPYIAANLRSLPALSFRPLGPAPAMRRLAAPRMAKTRGGEPFNVRYWGVGNESWGCGGNFTP